MSDAVPPNAVTPPDAKPAGATPLALNAAQTAAVKKAENICKAMLKPEYLPAFVAAGETEAAIQALLADCAKVRGFASQAIQKTTEKTVATGQEQSAEGRLVAKLQYFQKRARRKYARSATPEVLRDYFIGSRLEGNQSNLSQYAQSILDKLATDTLPGVSDADKMELTDLLAAFESSGDAQGGAQSGATNLRRERDKLMASIMDRRMEFQFTADAEFPHQDPANEGTRGEFYLPANRPFATAT